MREELSQRAEELARSQRDLRDLQTELSVANSGAGLALVPDELTQLRIERDELAARLSRLQTHLAAEKKGMAQAL
jgi:hypothetical protein